MDNNDIKRELEITKIKKNEAHSCGACNWVYWKGIEDALNWILNGSNGQTIKDFILNKS